MSKMGNNYFGDPNEVLYQILLGDLRVEESPYVQDFRNPAHIREPLKEIVEELDLNQGDQKNA